jgi:hypothetical protein
MTDARQDVAGVVAECFRPDGIMPVDSETTRLLTQAVTLLSKALTKAQSELSTARRVIGPFAEIDPVDAMFPIRVQTADVQAARRFINAGKE